MGDRALGHSFGRQIFKLFSMETELQVSTVVLVARWCGKGHSLVTLGNLVCGHALIVQVFWETKLWGILQGDRALRPYDSFSGKMVLKGLFFTDTGEVLALHLLFRSPGKRELWAVLPGDRASRFSPWKQSFESVWWQDGFEKAVLQWHWGSLGFTFIVQVSRETELSVNAVDLVAR